MRLFILFTGFIGFIAAVCCTPLSWGQQGTGASTPISIEADRMETIQQDGIVIFSGNVRASQGSLIINADDMTVQYSRFSSDPVDSAGTPAPLTQKIENILARGNVKIVQGKWVAAGDTMNFSADNRIVTLTGNAKAWQDQNMVTGEKIVLYLDKGKSVVERSTREGERVKAFIYPSSQEAKDSKTP